MEAEFLEGNVKNVLKILNTHMLWPTLSQLETQSTKKLEDMYKDTYVSMFFAALFLIF